VQLIIDRNAAVAGLIERTRAQGMVLGEGGDTLTMEYVPGTADVKPGDVVVTSGMDAIYPKGFVIGNVETANRGPGTFHKITVRPAVDFSRLEEVLVVTTPTSVKEAEATEAAYVAQQQVQARAAAAAAATNQSPQAVGGNQSPRRPQGLVAPTNQSPGAAPVDAARPRTAPPAGHGTQQAPVNQTGLEPQVRGGIE
jgi:rod shape-determining protein MreC